MQCTYGWDWVERFVTAGIEKDVTLFRKEKCEIDNVYVYTQNANEDTAQIAINVEFTDADLDMYAEYTICDSEGNTVFLRTLVIAEDVQYQTITLANPKLWYPLGYGESPLYDLTIKIKDRKGKIINEKSLKFGIRTVRIVEKADIENSEYYNKCIEIKKGEHLKNECENWDENTEFAGFIVVVNDIPIMCKGACWVPSDPFVSEQTEEKIKAALALSCEGNVNMIRIWGGGMFEKDCFYEECDRLGIMVTQDMLMACGKYPDGEADFCEHMEKEAEYAAYKLRNHPCLMFWSGDNENAIAANDNMPKYHGRKAVKGIIAKVMQKLDYNRRFLPSSPYGGIPYGSVTYGTAHNTQFLSSMFKYISTSDMKDYLAKFDSYLSRFVAEAPTFGACSPEMMKRFMSEEDIYGENTDIERCHTRNNPHLRPMGLYDYMTEFAKKVIGEFKDADDKLRKLQYAQYEWVRISLELYRRNKWFSSGIVFWQLNDCWPSYGSWALIDYYNFPKASYYSFKNSAKGVAASIARENGAFKVYVCNDTLSDANGKMTLYKADKNSVLKTWECDYSCPANESKAVFELAESVANITDNEVLICDIQGYRTIIYNTNPAGFGHLGEYEIIDDKDNKITVKANELVIGVELKGEFIFEDNYFILLPGEERTIKYRKFENQALKY